MVTPELVRAVFAEERERIASEISGAMSDVPRAAVHTKLALYRKAADDAETIFLEPTMRPFLTGSSELAPACKESAPVPA